MSIVGFGPRDGPAFGAIILGNSIRIWSCRKRLNAMFDRLGFEVIDEMFRAMRHRSPKRWRESFHQFVILIALLALVVAAILYKWFVVGPGI